MAILSTFILKPGDPISLCTFVGDLMSLVVIKYTHNLNFVDGLMSILIHMCLSLLTLEGGGEG